MRKRPWVPQSVIDDIRDIMPSKNLIIHEYRAHGTCSGLEPAQYSASRATSMNASAFRHASRARTAGFA